MNKIFAIFYHDSDGYTYSSETLCGVFLSNDEAETALLKRIELANLLLNLYKEYSAKVVQCQTENRWNDIPKIDNEWKETKMKYGIDDDYGNLPNINFEKYEIRPICVGEMLLDFKLDG